jgi:hypothetical protein
MIDEWCPSTLKDESVVLAWLQPCFPGAFKDKANYIAKANANDKTNAKSIDNAQSTFII